MSAEPARTTASPTLKDRSAPLVGKAPLAETVIGELGEMRRFLDARRPSSGNEALKLLRAAFPDSPLDVRVKAVADRGPAF